MGKERFTINPFPALELSNAEKNQLLELGRTIIEANFERDEAFFKGGRKVDHRRWKLSKERERMLVHTERPEYKGADAMSNTMHSSSKLPAILSVGRVEGKLDDMMYGVVNPTLEDMRIKASYVHDFDGAAVLSTIVEPTVDEPFNSVVVKWMEMDIPLRRTGVVQNRDYVYLECTGFVHMANGDRAGYHFLHSIDFPQIPKLSNRVRGDLSICGFFRQVGPNVLDVCKTGLMDPAGDMIRMLAVPVMTEAFLSPLRYVHCGQMQLTSSLTAITIMGTKRKRDATDAMPDEAARELHRLIIVVLKTLQLPAGVFESVEASESKVSDRIQSLGLDKLKRMPRLQPPGSVCSSDLAIRLFFVCRKVGVVNVHVKSESTRNEVLTVDSPRKLADLCVDAFKLELSRGSYRHVVRVWLPEEEDIALGAIPDRILVQTREFAEYSSSDAVEKALTAQLPLKILFRDDAIIVVDKPANVLSVDGTDPHAPVSVHR
ncbi:START-like domain [Phytophthora cactorum]|nr:START-like domain [Phytophthora cactorum]